MTRLIICSGRRAEVPYHFKLTGQNIYSIEELCYYIYQNIYMVTEDMFTLELAEFIARDLNLPERGDKLRDMIRVHAGLKDLVVCVLCSCDYFTEYEIKSMLTIIDEICDLSRIKRNALLADQCLAYKNYAEAKRMYLSILHDHDFQTLDEKEVGKIYHSLGVAQLHLTGFFDAAQLFKTAYEHNHNLESLHQYLFAIKLSSSESDYQKEVDKFTNGVAMDHMIREELAMMDSKISEDKEIKLVQAIKTLKDEGKTALYDREVSRLLSSWKNRYRQQNALQEG